MADEAGAATAQVMVYVANELQGVFSHISKALTEYQETGDLPDSVFEAEPAATAPTKRKRQKKDKDRVKRKPSAFNHYVKEQIAVLRARPQTDEEHNNNSVFAEAVANWKKLPDGEKKAYTEKFKAGEAAKEAAAAAAAAGDDDEDEEDEAVEEEEEEEEEEEPVKEPTPPPPPAKKEKKRKDKEGGEKKAEKKVKKDKAPTAAMPSIPAPAEAAAPAQEADAPKKKKKKNKDKDKEKTKA
ncbi:hypothetical protein WJX75_002647 [Coccomyxa subellipsoidea]|uniref:HMG box domain-containing protein n=1 Tax=Coccomyxa subellipsoidea TaxID=248742 RepID=A0ABR2YR11_9CHLO